jgi:hypothetical protein
MESNQELAAENGSRNHIDRYTTFQGIDCDGNARRLMAFIEHRVMPNGDPHPFLAYFLAKRTSRSGPAPDDLFLIHSNLNQIRESVRRMQQYASARTAVQA